MKNPANTFNKRAFVVMVMVFSGLALPITGLVNHFHAFGPMNVGRHAWMSAYNALGILFVAFSIWHAWLNRKALLNHMRKTAANVPAISRETILAGAIVLVFLVLFVGHTFHAGHR